MWKIFAVATLHVVLTLVSSKSINYQHVQSPAKVRIARARSLNTDLKMRVDAFGETHHLNLVRKFLPTVRMMELVLINGTLVVQEIKPNDTATEHYHDEEKGAMLYKNDNNKFEGMLNDVTSLKHVNNEYVVSKPMKIEERRLEDDELDMNKMIEENEPIFEDFKMERSTNSSNTYEAEVLVVVDYKLSRHFESRAYLNDYLRIYFMMVNRRFEEITTVNISIVLTGIIVSNSVYVDNYLLKLLGTDQADVYASRDKFASYIVNYKNIIPKHDIAHLLSKRDFVYKTQYSTSNSYRYEGIVKEIGCPCKLGKNSGISEDDGYYKGMLSTSRIIGHNLGAKLDTVTTCRYHYGYLMTSHIWKSTRNFEFSSCSQKDIAETAAKHKTCLQARQSSKSYPYINQLPGNYTSLNEQCRRATKNPEAHAYGTSCYRLQCYFGVESTRLYYYSYFPPLEGSVCGYNRICLHGKCTTQS